MRKTHEQLVAEVREMLEPLGIEWHELRNEVGRLECESGNWPEGEGMGSSDMNCLTTGMQESEPEQLFFIAQRLADERIARAARAALNAGVPLEWVKRIVEA